MAITVTSQVTETLTLESLRSRMQVPPEMLVTFSIGAQRFEVPGHLWNQLINSKEST